LLKILSLFLTILIAQKAVGAALALSCESPEGFKSQNRTIEVSARGLLETLGFGYTLQQSNLHYGIDCQSDGSCWAAASVNEADLAANRNYKPRRYVGFNQFSLSPKLQDQARLYWLIPDLSQVKEGGDFTAYLQIAGVNSAFGATVPLNCKGTPVKSLVSHTMKSARSEIASANQVIQDDFGLAQLNLVVDEQLLKKEIETSAASIVSLAKATQQALALILDEYSYGEVPLNLAAHGWSETVGELLSVPLTQKQKLASAQFLRQELNDSHTSLSLFLGVTVRGLVYPPEQGEKYDKNWIFVLRIPSLSDHIYWIVVDKKGEIPPFVYGFN
jgi:hypothetical protein